MEKNNRWCFTSWKKPDINLNLVNYVVYQKELTSDNKLEHYQGYIEFKNQYKLFQVKSLFKDKTIHCEIARKDRKANFLYCTKNQSYAGLRFEFGNLQTGINDNPEWSDILE